MRFDKQQEKYKSSGIPPKKNIDIHDSAISYKDMPLKKLMEYYQRPSDKKLWESTKLNPRTPFVRDDDLLNYDQDSEEEFNDFNGEALDDSEEESDDENDSTLYDGFI